MPETALNVSKGNPIKKQTCDLEENVKECTQAEKLTLITSTFAKSLLQLVESFEKAGKRFDRTITRVEKRQIEYARISQTAKILCDQKIERLERQIRDEVVNGQVDIIQKTAGH